jgi:16S rRNA (cytosine1402-N4)-methyltransferase
MCCAAPDPEPESEYHVPVMLNEVVSWMLTDLSGTYADGTLGGGGHSAALLEVLAPGGGQLIGLDRDPDALRVAGARLQGYTQSGHAKLVKSNFANMPDALRGAGLTPRPGETGVLDGLLVDLGVSSHQIDEGARGFSFMRDGPLDMRMDQSPDAKLTASEIVNEWGVHEIARVLWEYPRAG